MTTTGGEGALTAYAQQWAETIITVLRTSYPYAAQHVSRSATDVDVTPDRLHPAFHGSFDWHSSVHMQWSAVRILELAGDHLDRSTRETLTTLLDERLTDQHCEVEAAYLQANPHFERPYGWAWAAQLASTLARSPLPEAQPWAQAAGGLLDVVGGLVTAWLPRLAYPVRTGEHSNVAFALSLMHDAFLSCDRTDLVELVRSQALAWFGGDVDYPAGWEPGGSDFLSPALCESDLMRRVMEPSEYAEWLPAFLPGLGAADDPLLSTPQVRDSHDGKAVHLFGLALSRAWQLRLLASHLPADRRSRIDEVTRDQIARVQREIIDGDFMSTHWLVTFALLAVTAYEG